MPRHPPCALLRLISNAHVVSRPAIGPARLVLIPHTLPAPTHALASERPCGNRQTIHSSIVKEQSGSRYARRRPGPAKEKVMRAKREWSAGDF
jgi:hypothetical protein